MWTLLQKRLPRMESMKKLHRLSLWIKKHLQKTQKKRPKGSKLEIMNRRVLKMQRKHQKIILMTISRKMSNKARKMMQARHL